MIDTAGSNTSGRLHCLTPQPGVTHLELEASFGGRQKSSGTWQDGGLIVIGPRSEVADLLCLRRMTTDTRFLARSNCRITTGPRAESGNLSGPETLPNSHPHPLRPGETPTFRRVNRTQGIIPVRVPI